MNKCERIIKSISKYLVCSLGDTLENFNGSLWTYSSVLLSKGSKPFRRTLNGPVPITASTNVKVAQFNTVFNTSYEAKMKTLFNYTLFSSNIIMNSCRISTEN